MEFKWDDFSKKISDAADKTVRETEKLTEMAKLKYKLANEKTKLNALYQSIGKLRYAEEIGSAPLRGSYEDLFAQVRAVLAEIEELEASLTRLRAWHNCVACGEKVQNAMLFCPKCGTRQVPLNGEPAEEENAEDEPAAEEPEAESEQEENGGNTGE